MKFDILDHAGNVVNTILADPVWVEAKYPGRWRVVQEQPEVPATPRTLTLLAFRSRFTEDEKVAIYTLAKAEVRVQVWLDDLAAVKDSIVDLDDPRTAGGVQNLEALGVIAAGRAAEILA